MQRIGRYLYAAARDAIFNPPLASEGIEVPLSEEEQSDDGFQPKLEDIEEVKKIFLEELLLPLELVVNIVDFAEYWPHTTGIMWAGEEDSLYVRTGDRRENCLVVRTPPLGFEPLQAWKTRVVSNHEGTKTSTEVGPELEGTGRYPWSIDSAPRSVNRETDDNHLTKRIIEDWEKLSTTRGRPCRKVVFTIESHDQGWGGSAVDKGTFRGSFTWFDVGLERMSAFRADDDHIDDPGTDLDSEYPINCGSRMIIPRPRNPSSPEFPLLPERTCLQKNLTSTKFATKHEIIWRATDNIQPDSQEGDQLEEQGRGRDTLNGEFVRNLKMGDIITVWAKARFPGWCNVVESVKVDVYWAE
ncbi:hypothetical protein BJ875DRAFT_387174 [Amylocarpus encephaloides]|uniref:Uncharacterized protein n=1 Tax=Amylocarpus encephaloides TaxID=45428 RepID=A0A9P8C0R8_9HELO|nr:hypothetical protein BJ875DRAFT_387174 [Amylocarpus encephaloides]